MYCIDKKTSNGEESNNKRFSFSLMMYESQDGFEKRQKGEQMMKKSGERVKT